MATFAELTERVRKLGLSLTAAAKKGDRVAVAKWALQLGADALALAAVASPPTVAKIADIAPMAAGVPSNYFADIADGSTVYIVGGSPDNPNGVTLTFADAIAWWKHVFGAGLNVSRVRSTLMPGSKVLTPDGLAAARVLGIESTNFAPEDFNPLKLEVIA